MWTLVDLSPVVWLLLHWFEGLGVRGLLLHLDHIWGTGFGSGGEATQCGQGRSTVRVQTFGLEFSFRQENLPALHLLLQLVIVGLLPGVESQGGEADLLNLLFTSSKQQVPMGSRWQRYL